MIFNYQSQDQCIPSSFSIHKNLSLSENCGCFDINQDVQVIFMDYL